MRWSSADDDGITLVEIVVALFILGFVMSTFVAAQATSLQSLTDSRARQDASQVATEVLERLRDRPPSSIAMSPSFDPTTVSCGDPAVTGFFDVFGDGSLCEPLAHDPDPLATGVIDDSPPWTGSLRAVDYAVYATEVAGDPVGRIRVTVVATYELTDGPRQIHRQTFFSEISRG